MIVSEDIQAKQARIEGVLDFYLPPETENQHSLSNAVRYSVLGGGKRIRALLVYAAGEVFDAPLPVLDVLAASVELIHAYSLIHDDLPAMDDDDLRRGKPSCHIQFSEATAILAGDALQSLAFELIANCPADEFTDSQRVECIRVLSKAIGPSGMALGQMHDIMSSQQDTDTKAVTLIHQLKTGKLLEACVALGATAGNEHCPAKRKAIDGFANHLGLAFQIKDDILDIESCSTLLGKPQHSDQEMEKATFVQSAGLTGAKETLHELIDTALNYLNDIDKHGELLRQIAHFVSCRNH